MRIILIINTIILLNACLVNRQIKNVSDQHLFNTEEIKYLTRYIIEHSILHPAEWYPESGRITLLPNDSILNIYLNDKVVSNDELENYYFGFNDFFKDKSIDTIYPNSTTLDVGDIFNNYKVKIVHLKPEERTHQLDSLITVNTIMFYLTNIIQVGNKYYIPLTFKRLEDEIMIRYNITRYYEFEYCKKGIFNFKSYCQYFWLGPIDNIYRKKTYEINNYTCL